MKTTFQFGDISPFKYFTSIALGVGIFAGLITSQGTAEESLIGIVQWIMQTSIPMGLIVMCHIQLSRWKFFSRITSLNQLVTSGILGSLIFAPIGLEIDLLFGSGVDLHRSVTEIIREFINIVAPACLVWLLINAPFVTGLSFARGDLGTNTVKEHGSTFRPNFMRLVDPSIHGEVVYMKSELHYLLIVTTKGKDLILYSLKDAVREISSGNGFQSHRSWWVNSDHVIGFTQRGRVGEIVLTNGETVPVSRRQLQDAKAKFKSKLPPQTT